MKKTNLLLAILLFATQALFSQEFQFTIQFEDAVGNKDSLVLGTDSLATTGIDDFFGEVNIINDSLRKALEVVASDEWRYPGNNATFHAQKQIAPLYHIIGIEIKSNHYPIVARWDRSLFENEELDGTVMTSYVPGGWWDAGGGKSNMDKTVLSQADSIAFTPNYLPSENIDENHYYAYINEHNDTISLFWFAFGSFKRMFSTNTTEIEDMENIKVHPNPTKGIVHIKNETSVRIEEIEVVNIGGQEVKRVVAPQKEQINIADLEPGQYWIRIRLENQREAVRPIIKL